MSKDIAVRIREILAKEPLPTISVENWTDPDQRGAKYMEKMWNDYLRYKPEVKALWLAETDKIVKRLARELAGK